MSEKNTDYWFHMMVALLIDEALKGREVYVPAFRGKPDPLRIGMDGQPYAEEMSMQDMQMMINFNAQKASGSKVIYQLMPPQ